MYSWASKGWLKSDNKTPENLDIIKKIYELNKNGYYIRLVKVKGHKGIKGNELADDLATGRIKAADILMEE
jgi:ribonuclease HI